MDAATELYAEQGYRGTSLRDVAARAGISHPGLLHHFPTMEALLLAVLEHRVAEDVARFGLGAGRGVEALRRLVDLAAWNQARPGIVELFVVLSAEATAPDHPAHAYFTARYDAAAETIATAFADAQEAGQLRGDVDPDVAAHRVVALMDGLQVQWLYRRDAVDMAGELRDAIDGLLRDPLPGR
nr:TetR/AcrR family transcriptional regulator [Luteimicrobium album]